MFKWIKKGLVYNLINYIERPNWNYNFAQGQNTLIFDDFVRVYFCTREEPNQNGQTVSRVTYIDLDKNNLLNIVNLSNNPVLDLGELGEFDEFGIYPFCPIRIGDQIYGYYGGATRCESTPFNISIGYAVSNDEGVHFKKIGRGPILTSSLNEPFMICSPKVRFFNNTYYMMYSAGVRWTKEEGRPEICYKLRMATSIDGINWTKCNKLILEDKLGELESQACGDIIYKNGRYHMFYCYRGHLDFRKNKEQSYRIGYAVSQDLSNWTRKDELVGIAASENPNDFDYEMVAYPNVFELNGKIYMLYLGNEVGKYGFGLAELESELA